VLSAFGLGLIPFAPGTMGALGALVPVVLARNYLPEPNLVLSVLAVIAIFAGIAGATKVEPSWGKDPSKVVLDEVAGMLVSVLWLGPGWLNVAAAFILFRFFDIVKPLGIRRAEALPHGWGIMADDVVAGIYTNLVIQLVYLLARGI